MQKAISQGLTDFFKEAGKISIEIHVQELGSFILLRENIENVTDNWFTSSKYDASDIEMADQEGAVLKLTNVYQKNPSYINNEKNYKYNLLYEKIYIASNKIIAYF